ncbi:MAG: DUF1848 domain-containing protein, partial [Geobacter sp.]|nr:DUF1848 domain-containing protein [Geobacter sp.]
MIISASRRTDIPAFYSEWFMNRVRAGFLLTRNPFNPHQVRRVPLAPAEVDAIVFWTRNPARLMPHLPELTDRGFRHCFLFTITGYPRLLEPQVPDVDTAIGTFRELAQLIGPDKVVWRYDPVLVSTLVPLEEHQRLFSRIAAGLAGHTGRVIISCADIYQKVKTNLDRFAKESKVGFSDISEDSGSLQELAGFFSRTAALHDMEIQSCAEELDLDGAGIRHGKCIDDLWLGRIFKRSFPPAKDK